MEKGNEEVKKFLKGILFIVVGYIAIKLVNEYEVILGGLKVFVGMAIPFIMAFFIAYALNPVVNFIQKRLSLKRSISIMIMYLIVLISIGIGISFIMPKVYNSIVDIIIQIPDYLKQLGIWINSLDLTFNIESIDLEVFNRISNDIINSLPQIGEAITNSVGSLITSLVGLFTTTFNLFIAFVVCFYILLEKDKFCSYSKKVTVIIFGKKYGQYAVDVTRTLHQNIGKYLIGKSIDSMFVGMCAVVGLTLIKAKYALLLGIVFGITNMVPYIGPIVGTAIAVGINLFYNPTVALIALVYLLIVQQVETLIIDPKVVGKQLGLSPFFTLFAVSIGGKLFGIPGMVLGVPVVAILKKYGVKWINKRYDEICE